MGRLLADKSRRKSLLLSYQHVGTVWLQQVLQDGSAAHANALNPSIAGGVRPLELVLLRAADTDPRALHLLDRLLAAGANPSLCPDAWSYVLEAPACLGYDALPLVQRLLQAGLHPDAPGGRKGRTALHLLLEGAHWRAQELLWQLLAAGADVNAEDDEGWTPLHFLCRRQPAAHGLQVLGTLLASGANPTATDEAGSTPLHLLSEQLGCGPMPRICQQQAGHWVALLLAHGADPLAPNARGVTPLESMVRLGHAHALQAALQSGSGSAARGHAAPLGCLLHAAVQGLVSWMRAHLPPGADLGGHASPPKTPLHVRFGPGVAAGAGGPSFSGWGGCGSHSSSSSSGGGGSDRASGRGASSGSGGWDTGAAGVGGREYATSGAEYTLADAAPLDFSSSSSGSSYGAASGGGSSYSKGSSSSSSRLDVGPPPRRRASLDGGCGRAPHHRYPSPQHYEQQQQQQDGASSLYPCSSPAQPQPKGHEDVATPGTPRPPPPGTARTAHPGASLIRPAFPHGLVFDGTSMSRTEWRASRLARGVAVVDVLVDRGAELTEQARQQVLAMDSRAQHVSTLVAVLVDRRPWRPSSHARYPPAFRAAAAALLMCHHRAVSEAAGGSMAAPHGGCAARATGVTTKDGRGACQGNADARASAPCMRPARPTGAGAGGGGGACSASGVAGAGGTRCACGRWRDSMSRGSGIGRGGTEELGTSRTCQGSGIGGSSWACSGACSGARTGVCSSLMCGGIGVGPCALDLDSRQSSECPNERGIDKCGPGHGSDGSSPSTGSKAGAPCRPAHAHPAQPQALAMLSKDEVLHVVACMAYPVSAWL